MSSEPSGPYAAGLEGLNSAGALHQPLRTTVILVEPETGAFKLAAGASWLTALQGMPEALGEPLRTLAREAAASGRPVGPRTFEVSKGLVGVTGLPLGPQSKPGPVALVVQDLTSLRQFEERLLQLDRLASLGTLAAGMAHEVKNALVASKTFIDLLLEKNPETELVPIVRRELARIDTIVTRTLKFAGDKAKAFTALHAHEVLEHCLCLIERPMESKSVTVVRSLEASSDVVDGDEHELQQAFVNLLLNAVEALGPKGTLKVSTRLDSSPGSTEGGARYRGQRQLCITIEDSGVGIPPEILSHLFEPFVTSKPDGTGLGLAITQQIIHQHRGSISVKSTLDQGTIFTVTLPSSKRSAQPA